MTWRVLVGGPDSSLLGCCRWTLPEGPAGAEGDFASMLVSTPVAGPGLPLMLKHLLSGLLGVLVIPLSSFPTLTNPCCVLIVCNKLRSATFCLISGPVIQNWPHCWASVTSYFCGEGGSAGFMSELFYFLKKTAKAACVEMGASCTISHTYLCY